MKSGFITVVAAIFIFIACKKKDSNPGPGPGSGTDRIKDSVVLYARDIYLWYSQIPSSFNGQSYADPDAIMTAIRSYSMEPGFSQPVDRWSFGIKKTEWDNVSSGSALDFGMNVFFRVEGDLRVRFLEKASPAGIAGIKRGWRITKINNNTNITTANANFIIDAVYNSTSSSFTFLKPDGSSVDITLNGAAYQEHPVFLDSVYTAGTKKVGYLVFNSFLGDTTEIKNEFQRVFNKFAAQNVDEVAVDLRYNGGGYVSLQQKLANYLVPAVASGQVMMREEFNDKYTQFNETLTFQKQGALNLPRVFFIVSSNTASASELLINNLKPFMNVFLVGPNKTYGKPVGYFPIPVGEWYIFPVSFRSTNKNGEGNYFDGFALNNTVADGLDKDWGDVDETAFASVLKYITTGAFRTQPAEAYKEDPVVSVSNRSLDKTFKGMVDTKKRF
ncbi:MAG TPA: S41 family peptidase [Chitinophagaceae bacterium]|nr:S41 family peptidase [Chitinophagaceae bacterium]